MLSRELNGPSGAHASVYFFVEVNRPTQRRSLSRILPGWDVARSARGHNDAYSDPDQQILLGYEEFSLGTATKQQRYVTIARYEHLLSGVRWTGATTHLSSSAGTTAERAAKSRSLQALRLAELCLEHQVDVIAADLNNIAVRPGTPRATLQDAGYTDWRQGTDVKGVEHDTHHALGRPLTTRGRHLDAIYLGPRVSVLDGEVLTSEPNSSDHLGLVCTISIADKPAN
jgi:endonuclease/exonuclease/phosphatase family metal-dependent hydrolase